METTMTMSMQQTISMQQMSPPRREGKYLTFNLGREEYGIAITAIREIIGLMPAAAVPRAPTYFLGVINLRGTVIPVIDLRRRFEMETVAPTERTCIVVVEVADQAGRPVVVGIVVDSVSEVLNIREGEIEDSPAFAGNLEGDCILGMAKTADGGVKILLAIDRVLATDALILPSLV